MGSPKDSAAAETDKPAPTENKRNNHSNDFVIREGFPALRLPTDKASASTSASTSSQQPSSPWWLEGDEPLPRRDLWSCRHTIESSDWDALRDDCRTVFAARTREDTAAYSAGVTYFWPMGLQPPRCALEGLVAEIFQRHTQHLPAGVIIPESSGAEWWTLVLDENEEEDGEKDTGNGDEKPAKDAPKAAAAAAAPVTENDEEEEEDESDEVGLHFDADYGLEDQAPHLFLHPRLATVTYLTDAGAPTVIFQKRSPPPPSVSSSNSSANAVLPGLEGPISRGWVSHPLTGKHVAFDGRLLHGAPATFFPARSLEQQQQQQQESPSEVEGKEPPTKKQKTDDAPATNSSPPTRRITLLVNIWINHCPLDAEPLDDDICKSLTCPWPSSSTSASTTSDDKKASTTDTKPNPEQQTKEQPFRWLPSASDLADPGDAPLTVTPSLRADPDDPAGEEEVVIGQRLVTAYYNPNMTALHAAATSAHLVELPFESGALDLKVGEAVVDSDDDSGE